MSETRHSTGRESGREPGRDAGAAGPRRGLRRADRFICEDVNDAIAMTYDIESADIEVRVQDGHVTLDGTVPSRNDKFQAEWIAHSVMGVRDVENNLRIAQARGE